MAKKLLCTASTVGMLWEDGRSREEISRKVGESVKTVSGYLRTWRRASSEARRMARMGTNIS